MNLQKNKIMRWAIITLVIIIHFSSCSSQIPIDDIKNQPTVKEKDQTYKDVYQLLDGTWEGEFLIFEDTTRASKEAAVLYNISQENWSQLPIKQVSSLQVKQRYESSSPYFQKVNITDYYPESGKTVTSEGVNKVQDGQMWCVVHKPDETIIHKGSLENAHTIIWQRNEQNPQRIEYFRETVEANTYSILGWGYYEGDDADLMPKYWFFAKYRRVD